MTRRSELDKRLSTYAEHYGFKAVQLDKGLEAYAVHLFAQEDGLDWVLDGQATEDADLGQYIFRSNDLGIDGALTDGSGGRAVIIQCTTQAVNSLEQKLESFTSVIDRLKNPELVEKAGEPLKEIIASLPDGLGEECSVELRFVSNKALGDKTNLRKIVDAANTAYDEAGRKISLELYGSADLLDLDENLRAATTGAPIGEVSFSIQDSKLLRWEMDSGAPRDTLIGLIKGNELASLADAYGTKLFASNIRLPLVAKKVNPDIRKTAESSPDDFFYFNNGVSAVCKKYEVNGTKVTATGFQVINGAQTVDSLRKALKRQRNDKIYVMFRLTASETYGKDKNFTENVIRYNNTQNPVKAYDFFSNDPIQQWLTKNLDKYSGKGVMPTFYYVHKSGHKPPNTAGRRGLKIDAFAGIRHSFLYGPIAHYREPAAFFDRAQLLYGEAFGVNGKIEDSWDDETLAEAACAIAINNRVQKISKEFQAAERELRKKEPDKSIPEARYLFRLSRYVTALVGVGLRAIMPSKVTDFRTLMASEATFNRYIDPLTNRALDLVADEMVTRMQGKELRSEYNFGRDDKTWEKLRTRMEGDALVRIHFD